jgi:hypothetical protein
MTTVGLGKQIGAQQAHTHGLWDSVKAVPQITLAKAKIICGVAMVENAFRQPAVVEIVSPKYEAFRESDERLLEVAKPHVADLPFEQLDLLIVDELGKDISGTGMDLNVIGNWRMTGGERKPDFRRIVVLSLTVASLGNGLGIGLADFTTERFAHKFDWQTTYVNLFTATEPGLMNTREGQLPLALASDKEAIEVGLFSSLASVESPRVCWIKNTARLDEFWVSEALLKELEGNEKFSVEPRFAPNGESSEPSGLYLRTAKSELVAKELRFKPTRILPSGWIKTASAWLAVLPSDVVTMPPLPNVGSNEPFGLYRTTVILRKAPSKVVSGTPVEV